MCRQIHQAAKDPLVQSAAMRALRFQGGPFGFTPAEACWCWCKHYLRFKHHGSMFEAWSGDLGDPRTKLQLLIAPDVLVRMNRMEGDCAIYTMMLCAMLEALGLQWQIVTAAVDRTQPAIFSHVWARAGNESLDASHGTYPGWQVPQRDLHRVWVFDANGSRVAEEGARFAGLHAYRRRGMGDGVDPETGETYGSPDTTTLDYGSSYGYGTSPTYNPVPVPANEYALPDGSAYVGSVYKAPSSNNSAQWASFATSLAKMGFTLAEINSIQPGTVVSANGQILRQNPGYAVGSPTGALNFGSSNMLLYVGLGLVAVFLLPSLMGRR